LQLDFGSAVKAQAILDQMMIRIIPVILMVEMPLTFAKASAILGPQSVAAARQLSL
jgi:hypothetical protein